MGGADEVDSLCIWGRDVWETDGARKIERVFVGKIGYPTCDKLVR